MWQIVRSPVLLPLKIAWPPYKCWEVSIGDGHLYSNRKMHVPDLSFRLAAWGHVSRAPSSWEEELRRTTEDPRTRFTLLNIFIHLTITPRPFLCIDPGPWWRMILAGKHVSSPILHEFPDSSNTWSCPQVCIIWAFVWLICGRNKIIRPSFEIIAQGLSISFFLVFNQFQL